ncbi:stage II sporulation protein D [Ureibacillus thermosphaericus]|jgi:stage II sporulation protein D|uniref:stage II sporulation protein D n=1 Tax=Ureibacillus thermosphaericus TaxID=51173 RepID=UPI0003196D16|nr:stage II sporulation protein D [Ureibacillus thermosphaericus]
MKPLKIHKNLIPIFSIALFILALFFLPFLFKNSNKTLKEASGPLVVAEEECNIYIRITGQKDPIPLEEYVVGVVAAEMPANFHPEALKAQAIAARTYVLKSTNNGQTEIEPTVLRQVFYDEDTRKANWQSTFDEYEQKIRQAVESTRGEVLKYDGELITAMFHSMSNGRTESSLNYSGVDLPYLQSVASADFHAENYVSKKTLTLAEWNKLLKVNMTLDDIKKIRTKQNNTGRVEKVIAGNKEWTGRDFRTLLDLRSTDFTIQVVNDKIEITTEGYGHGVGMSQYGADAMAKQGRSAHEILAHYYKGTTIEKMMCKK